MASFEPSGILEGDSPSRFIIHEDHDKVVLHSSPASEPGHVPKHDTTAGDGTVPLISDKLGNIQPTNFHSPSLSKKLKVEHTAPFEADENGDAMGNLLAKLSEQQALLEKQRTALANGDRALTDANSEDDKIGSTSSASPTAGDFTGTPLECVDTESIKKSDAEVELLKKELDACKEQIAKQEQELTKTRIIKKALDGKQPHNAACENAGKVGNSFQGMPNPGNRNGTTSRNDVKSEISDTISGQSLNSRTLNSWDTNSCAGNFQQGSNIWGQAAGRSWINRPMLPSLPPLMVPSHPVQPGLRTYSGPSSPTSGEMPSFFGSFNQFAFGNGARRNNNQGNRSGSTFNPGRGGVWNTNWNNGEISPAFGLNGGSYQPMGMFQAPQVYHPRPIGSTPLSPTAAEFTVTNNGGPWNAPSSPGQTYVAPMEPLNYRRLLDRSVTCNWKYIVDKIVCNNDQQASIFLQQKLKVGTAEQKYEIVEAIVAQAYPLMVNRFGNFLVQRCFEHGTPEQVIAIANAIRGNTLSLSMDAFGCHVVQKAFDAVPEEYKAIMVHELLRRIPETVIHRYACHVWQKLFELRWSDSPPQIMKYVNEALRGMWHEVALGETGSLVVQNIFENCLEEDKRPCIDEVLKSIDIVAHGQFGNWCIQHICEHGAPADRSRAVDHVLRYATEYSMDQFASKVVEKCLKIGGSEFLERYLDRVCEGRLDRPRIPLIDIASDQYGNYLIQHILTHANAQHREIVASHIRKHMVSLRGSKFGSRVGLLCCNPAYATRPGPAVPTPTNRFNSALNAPGNRYGGQFR